MAIGFHTSGESTASALVTQRMTPEILIVIPARGGSKGIPRKNVRPLAGRPLITYAVRTALRSSFSPDVYVSSDDEEILALAEQAGAKSHRRDPELAADATTLDPVVIGASREISEETGRSYDLVVTMQPTSPLLRTETLDAAIRRALSDEAIDTILSAADDTHLTWRKEGDRFVPNYSERANRQYLTPTYRETGGFVISRPRLFASGTRIGSNVELYVVSDKEAVDIDHPADWSICEYFLSRKRIVFIVSGYPEIGLGHAYNTLAVAHELVEHDLMFLIDQRSDLAAQKIREYHYPVLRESEQGIVQDVSGLNPHVAINDCLDTSADYVDALKRHVPIVVNFEDLGPGARRADMVINAIYPETQVLPEHYFGPRYFCLRDEFLGLPEPTIREKVETVLVTFGGVDPNDLTRKILRSITPVCAEEGIRVVVIAGLGYRHIDELEDFGEIEVVYNTPNIARYMREADLCFTSAGRTTYELAAVGTPTVVLAQNERELTHFFASEQYGFVHLGLGREASEETIRDQFEDVLNRPDARRYMSELMRSTNVTGGRARVAALLRAVLKEV